MSGYNRDRVSEPAMQLDYVQTIFTALKRRMFSIVCYTLLLTALMAAAIQFIPKTYRAVASIEVLSKTPLVANPDVFASSEAFTDETAGTELGILESQELRTAVIRKLNLLTVAEFNPDAKPSRLARFVAYIKTTALARYLPDEWLEEGQPVSEGNALFDAVETFAKHVKAEPVSHSKIIQISVTSRDPHLAADIGNEVVAEYVSVHQRQKIDAYAQAYRFAQERLPTLKAEMLEKSVAVDKFRQDHNMVSGQYAAIRREKLTEASKQVVDATNKLGQLKAQAAQAKVSDPMSNPSVLASLTIQRLREQKSQILAEAASKPALWGPNYALRAAAVEGQIRGEADRIIASLPGQVAAQEAAVEGQLADYATLQIEVGQMDRLQSELDPLENDARIAMRQYNDFKSSDSATKPDVAFVGVNVRILSSAAIPYRAYFPNNMLMIPASLVLAFGCVTGLSLYHGRRIGFATTLQLQDTLQMVPIGRIPYRTRRTEQVYWDSLLSLSMRLVPPYEENAKKHTVLVTSAQPNEGKTTITQGLAKVLARRNISVALVNADLRVVRMPRRGQQPLGSGLIDILHQSAALDDVVIKRAGVSYISAGSRPANSSALIASNGMAQLLISLQATHDVVLIDGPPAPVGGDVYALSRLATRVLFVIKQSDTNERQVGDALASVSRAPEDIGVVLNMIRATGDDDDELAFSPRMIAYYGSSSAHYDAR